MRASKFCISCALSFALCSTSFCQVALAQDSADITGADTATSSTKWLEFSDAGFDIDTERTGNFEHNGSRYEIDIYLRIRPNGADSDVALDLTQAIRYAATKNAPTIVPGDFLVFRFHITNESGHTVNYVPSSYTLFRNYDVDTTQTSLGTFTKEGNMPLASYVVPEAKAPDGSALHYGNLYNLPINIAGPFKQLSEPYAGESANSQAALTILNMDKTLANLGYTGEDAFLNYVVDITKSSSLEDLYAHPERIIKLYNSVAPFTDGFYISNDDYGDPDYGSALIAGNNMVFDGASHVEKYNADAGKISARFSDPKLASLIEEYITKYYLNADLGADDVTDASKMSALISFADKASTGYLKGDSYLSSKIASLANGQTADVTMAFGANVATNNIAQNMSLEPKFSLSVHTSDDKSEEPGEETEPKIDPTEDEEPEVTVDTTDDVIDSETDGTTEDKVEKKAVVTATKQVLPKTSDSVLVSILPAALGSLSLIGSLALKGRKNKR